MLEKYRVCIPVEINPLENLTYMVLNAFGNAEESTDLKREGNENILVNCRRSRSLFGIDIQREHPKRVQMRNTRTEIQSTRTGTSRA